MRNWSRYCFDNLEDATSTIIIDGYNLIGIAHKDLQKKREELINMLINYRKIKGHDITVVFDGWKSGSNNEFKTVTGGITVIYSRLGIKADAVIKRMISESSKELIVITSDREISSHAWSHGSIPIPSSLFISKIESLDKVCSGEYEPLDEDIEPTRKGRSRTLSKKDRALVRAIKKL